MWRHYLVFILILLSITQCSSPSQSNQVENLNTLAKTYGYLRFFHPSDEGSKADWDKVLLQSVEEVLKSSPRGLKNTLKNQFSPLAPTMQILTEGDDFQALPKVDSTGNLVTIAWYHRVAPQLDYSSNQHGMSRRIGRNWLSERDIASAYQMINFPIVKGEDFELELKIKIESEDSLYIGQAMIQVNEQKHEIELKPSDWQTINFKGTIDKSSEQLFVIARLFPSQKCTIQIDDIKLAVAKKEGDIIRVPVYNHDFSVVEDSLPKHWELTNNRHGQFTATQKKGNTVLQFEKTELPTWQEHPQYGETIDANIGQGLKCRIPLALWGDAHQTISPKNEALLNRYLKDLEKIDLENTSKNSLAERIANIILVWNLIQHFHHSEIDNIVWEEQLKATLHEAYDESVPQDILLQKMVSVLGKTECWIALKDAEYSFIPASIRLIDNQFTVVQSDVRQLQIGDIILEKDGKNQEEAYNELEAYFHANVPYTKRWFTKRIESFRNAEPKQKVNFKIKRKGKTLQVEVPSHSPERLSIAVDRPSIESLNNGIEYINMANLSLGEFRYNLHKYKNAKGLIIDLRGTSTLNVKEIFPYFSKDTIPPLMYEYAATFHPNRKDRIWQKINNFPREKAEMTPLFLSAPKVFLVDENTGFQFEFMADWFKHKKIGRLVGDASFGMNYGSKVSPLIGDYEFRWNPYRITYRDGQQERKPIEPDVLIKPSMDDIIARKDVVLEKGIELLSEKVLLSQIQ